MSPTPFADSHKLRLYASGVLLTLSTLLAGCGGGGGSVAPPPVATPSPQVTSVIVSPNSVTTLIGASQQFNAQVNGVGNFSSAVTWSVSGVTGGNNSVGTISSSGLYTAPPAVPASPAVTISATSLAAPAITGTAQENIISGITSVTVTPTNLSMPAGQSQQFHVVVGGVANQAVIWSITGPTGISTGTVSPGGLYTPPNGLTEPTNFNITATSVLDPHAAAFGSVLVFPPPVLTGVTPNSAGAGEQVTLQGSNFGPIVSVQFTGPNQIALQAVGSTQLVVPHSATSGPIVVTEQFPGFDPVTTNSIPFTRIPRLRIRAESRDLSAGESTQVHFRILGEPAAQTITWSADLGTIDATGLYQAPGAVLGDSFAHVTGCIAATVICDSQILGLHPFRISPFQPIVPLGGTLQLSAIAGGAPVAASWAQSTGAGVLAANGSYSAGVNLPDAGTAAVSADFSSSTERASIAVTGGFPGLVQRVNDYIDFTAPIPFGTVDESVAVSGTRAFVLASGSPGALFFDKTYFWIDVYDITDPLHPVWIDVVEAASRGSLFTSGAFLYQLSGFDTTQGTTFPSIIASFDITGQQPVLVAQRVVPSSFFTGFENGVAVAVPGSGFSPLPPGTVSVYDLAGGVIRERDFLLKVNGSPVAGVASATASQGRLFAIFNPGSGPSQLGVFDLATDPPAFLGAVNSNARGVMKVVGNLLFVGGDVFDISASVPVRFGGLAGFQAAAVNGNLVYATTFQDYARIIDFASPASPKLRSVIAEVGVTGGANAQWVGNQLLLAEGAGGLAVFDAELPGGLVEQSSLPGGGTGSLFTAALDQIATASNLFVATSTDTVGVVNVYDITSVPAVRVGKLETGAQVPVALALAGTTLYVGTDSSLLVVDAGNPAAPSLLGSLPVGPVTSLARSGNTLYLGTLDGHLLVFDISQPTAPVQGVTLLLPGVADRLAVSANLLLVADDVAGFLLFNIAVPSNPVPLSQALLPGAVADVAVDGSLALLASADAGLLIMDISNPATPTLVGQAKLDLPQRYGGPAQPKLATTIAVHDSIAYVGALQNNATLFGFDYRQPAHPRLVSLSSYAFGTDDSLLTLRVAGNSLFVGGSLESLDPVVQTDLTQPRNVINNQLLPAPLVPLASAALRPLVNIPIAALRQSGHLKKSSAK